MTLKNRISRRKFIQGVASGVILTPLLSLPDTFKLPTATPFSSRYIPGWTPQYKNAIYKGHWSFENLFARDFFLGKLSSDNVDIDDSVSVFHQNLYDPPKAHKGFEKRIDFCVISAELKDINDIERLCLFKDIFQRSFKSLGCFTLPSGLNCISSVMEDKHFIHLLNKLPCPVVLVDAKRIGGTVPKLPRVNSHNNNDTRILQTAIFGILAPVLLRGFVGFDVADLGHTLNSNQLIGVGVGYMNKSENLEKAAENAFNTICNQMAPGMNISSQFSSCWVSICGSENVLSIDVYQAVANRVHSSVSEDACIFISLNVDDGLGGDIMITCFGGLS